MAAHLRAGLPALIEPGSALDVDIIAADWERIRVIAMYYTHLSRSLTTHTATPN